MSVKRRETAAGAAFMHSDGHHIREIFLRKWAEAIGHADVFLRRLS
jgi:hypothetical protein